MCGPCYMKIAMKFFKRLISSNIFFSLHLIFFALNYVIRNRFKDREHICESGPMRYFVLDLVCFETCLISKTQSIFSNMFGPRKKHCSFLTYKSIYILFLKVLDNFEWHEMDKALIGFDQYSSLLIWYKNNLVDTFKSVSSLNMQSYTCKK